MTKKPLRVGPAAPFPVIPVATVRRGTLIEQLDRSEAAVIAVTAAGGFGKSTLLSQWLRESPKRVVWLQIPAGADSTGVAERIARELSPVPSPSLTVLPTVHDDALWFSVVLPALHNVVSQHQGPFVLVLDDAMNVADERFDALLDALATALPADSQLVVSLRGATPHAVRRLRATGRTLELDAADLAMSDDEARLLLDELSVHLPEDQLTHLVTRTEGWPVGIYLLGRAILKDPDLLVADEVPGLATGWITDFIRDELFEELAEEDKTVLLRISVLDELTAGVCDAAADLPGSLQRLRQLAVENQLIRSVHGEVETYRFHPLFAEFLKGEMLRRSPSELEYSHVRAAAWYAANNDDDRAVAHLRETGDDRALGDFIWSRAWRLLATGHAPTLERWLAGVDEDRILAQPALCLTAAWIRTHDGNMAEVTRYADRARVLLQGPGDPQRSHVDVTAAVIGRTGLLSIRDLCSDALESAGLSDPWSSLAYYLRGVAQLHFDRIEEGLDDLLEGRRIAEQLGVTHMIAHCLATEAMVRLSQGENEAAGDLVVAARKIVFDNQLEHIPTGAPIFTASALVLLAAGRRSQAVDDAGRALRLTALMEPIAPWHAVEGRLRLGQSYWQLGDRKRAAILTQEARDRYVPAAHSPLLDRMLKEAEDRVAAVDTTPGPSVLTTAELLLLHYLPSHLSFPEIGQRLYLSRHTVKSQALSAYRKLGVTSRGGAVTAARELGLLPPG